MKQVKTHIANYWLRYTFVFVVVCILTVVTVYIFKPVSNENSNPAVNEYRKELPDLEKMVNREPRNTTIRMDYAIALYATGEAEEAKNQYEKVVELDNKNATAYNNLGNAYRDLKQIDKAVEAYKKAISLNNKLVNPYFNLASIQQYSLKRTDQAIDTYVTAAQALPENEQIMVSLALSYEANKEREKAKQVYESVLAKNPENSAAQSNLDRLQKQ